MRQAQLDAAQLDSARLSSAQLCWAPFGSSQLVLELSRGTRAPPFPPHSYHRQMGVLIHPLCSKIPNQQELARFDTREALSACKVVIFRVQKVEFLIEKLG